MSRYNFEAEMSEIIALGIGVEDGENFCFVLVAYFWIWLSENKRWIWFGMEQQFFGILAQLQNNIKM